MRGLMFSVCLVLLSYNEGQAQLSFHCRRPPGLPCSGNGACQTDGSCICDPPFNGAGDFDCSLNVSPPAIITVGSACTIPCQNGGSCYKPDPVSTVGEECSCPPEFAGPDCGTLRGTISQCRIGDMFVRIYPQASSKPFRGTVAVQIPGTSDTLTMPGCMATTATLFSWNSSSQRFSLALATTRFSNPCLSGLLEQLDPATGALKLCYEIRLSYDSLGSLGITDETFTFCCTEVVDTVQSGFNVGNTGNQPGGGVNVEGSIQIITSRLFFSSDLGTDVRSTDQINVGTELTLTVEFVTDGVRYQDLNILDCTAMATGLPDRPLLVNGCPAEEALYIVRNVRKGTFPPDSKNKIFVDIWAFKPSADISTVRLVCSVQPCLSTCPPRSPAVCQGSTIANVGRKKRAADNLTEPIETLTTTSSFSIHTGVPQATTQKCEKCEECGVMKEVFLPVAVVFGIVLLIVLFLAVFLCVRYNKGRNNKIPA